ncbi:MAG: SDR family oxidoreductase [Candidatus Neptunochlamydia sp.]|nr:SDR family oxidoreductase [Candidatus Neptunochlamydia sp.]
MKALITGGAGFIGSHLTELLLEKGHHAVVLDNLRSGRVSNFNEFKDHPRLQFVQGDIRKIEEIRPHFESVDWTFHLAALADIVPSIENPRKYFEVNVDGTFNILECSKEANVKRFLYAASSSCYGIPDMYPTPETAPIRPQYPYALTKFLGEELVMHWEKVYKLPALSLRLFNVFGPRARTTGTYGAVFGVFLTQKLNNKPLTVVGDGSQTRDFTFVKDVAKAFLKAAESSVSGETFNVGSGDHYSVNRIIELLNHDSVNIPKRPGEPDATFADVSKIEKILGFKVETSFEEGVSKLLEKTNDFKDAPLWEEESIKEATKAWFQYLS